MQGEGNLIDKVRLIFPVGFNKACKERKQSWDKRKDIFPGK